MSKHRFQECCPNAENHLRLHRSWRSILVSLVVAVLVTGLVMWGSLKLSHLGLQLPLGRSKIFLPVYLLVGLILFSRPLLLMFDCTHEISCHHVRSTQGRCSLRRQFVEISFEEILGVRASQSIIERFLGVGSILVWTASAEHPDLVIKGIKDPEYYARFIGGRLDDAMIKARRQL